MTVPEGMKVYIGRKRYKAGDKLPDGYKLPEKKKSVSEPVKKEADNK